MGKFWPIWAAVCFAAALAFPAHSQVVTDPAFFTHDPADPEVLVLEGAIDGRTPLLFRRALQQYPTVNTLALKSGGGSVYAALPMAYEVRDAGLKTTIPSGGLCASACSFLFFAGVERNADGQLGVHRISGGNADLATGQVALGDIFSSFEDFGVPTGVIARMMNTPADQMYWFQPEEMTALGLIGREPAPVAKIPSVVEKIPNMMAAEMTLEFPGADAVNFASRFRSAAWAGDASPDCDGELQRLDDGGALCSVVVSGTIAELEEEGTDMNAAGLSFVPLANGLYQMTWDLEALFAGELGSMDDLPPRNVFEALMGDDAWAFHIVANRVLETNGILSADRKSASMSILMTDIFSNSDARPKVFTALVRIAHDGTAATRPQVSAPAPAEPQAVAAAPALPAPAQSVLTVKPSGGDYREIAAAVAAAPEGARIEVYPGTYRQGVEVNKSLEIVGVGGRDAIIWEVTGDDVIEWYAPGGRISGMTLRQLGTNDSDAWSAVTFGAGTTVLEDCDLTAEDAAVVMVYGSATAPTLTGNVIRDGGESGIYFYNNARGNVEGNEIFGNNFSGVEISGGADPILRGNTIRDGVQTGINVYEDGRGTIVDNDIFGNALRGVEISRGAAPQVRENRIHDNAQSGVWFWDNGQGTLEKNEIYANSFAGIEIKTGSDPVVRANIIRDGVTGGIMVLENGRGTIEQNDVFGNAKPGIEIKTGADPVVRGNRIYSNGEAGVFVWDNGLGLIEGNDIYGNTLAGVEITTGSDPKVRGNSIRDGNQGGMLLTNEGRGLIEGNDIFANALAGINIGTGADPVVRGNKIHDGKTGGIFVYENGLGTIETNEIFANGYSGIEIKEGADPVVRDNEIHDGKQSGIYINTGGFGQISANRIRNNAYEGIAVTGGGAPVASGNTISGNRVGIKVYDGGMGTYTGNDLQGNVTAAFQVENAGAYTARDNVPSQITTGR